MKSRQHFQTFFLAGSSVFFASALIFFPKASLDASIRGLNMWWEIVFPSLLPFFIVSEILISFGVVAFIGLMLEPLMRPLFRVPGAGGFVWAMGIASGFPAGAKLTARLRQEKQITAIEAERLVSFTNSSNPLFLFGVVAVGFFHNAELGFLLAAAHYLGNVTVGLTMRFYRAKEETLPDHHLSKFSLKEALHALHEARMKDKRPLGAILGDAVSSSIQTLLVIGGFIILFSVLNRLLDMISIIDFLSLWAGAIMGLISIPHVLSEPFISGLFEITLGSQLISQTEQSTLLPKVIVTSFILAFNGFSVQAQVASILAETDIRFLPFFIARLLHGIFAGVFAYVLWKPLYLNDGGQSQPHLPATTASESLTIWERYTELLTSYGSLFTVLSLSLYVCIVIAGFIQQSNRLAPPSR